MTPRRFAALRLLLRFTRARYVPLEAAIPPLRPIVARWLALPVGPFFSRTIGGRVTRDGEVCTCYLTLARVTELERLAEAEHRDDGADDLSGIAGLFWNLVAS